MLSAEMKKAMASLRWVAYEEFAYAQDDSGDEEAKVNDKTDSSSSEVDDKADNDSESAEFEGEG